MCMAIPSAPKSNCQIVLEEKQFVMLPYQNSHTFVRFQMLMILYINKLFSNYQRTYFRFVLVFNIKCRIWNLTKGIFRNSIGTISYKLILFICDAIHIRSFSWLFFINPLKHSSCHDLWNKRLGCLCVLWI